MPLTIPTSLQTKSYSHGYFSCKGEHFYYVMSTQNLHGKGTVRGMPHILLLQQMSHPCK